MKFGITELCAVRGQLQIEVQRVLAERLRKRQSKGGSPQPAGEPGMATAGNWIRGPGQNHLELAAAGIPHQGLEAQTPGLRARYPVRELFDDLISALLSHLLEVMKLSLWVLVQGRDM